MSTSINLLVIEDNQADFKLLARHLEQHGLAARCHCVGNLEELEAALARGAWDAVLSDYSVPKLDFQQSLDILQARHPDLPLILVSGIVGEEKAVELVKLGVWDFVLKDSLVRLVPAIVRSLRDADERRSRRQAEAALLASELRYRRLFEAAKDGILILDAETGVIVDVNSFLVQLLGISHEAFLGKQLWELGFFKDVAANQASFAELQEKEYIRYKDLPLRTADGRQIDVEFVSNVYPVNHHKVIQCNIREITDRKRSEAALRASEQEFRSMFEVASIGMAQADPHTGQLLRVNQKLCAITGYSADEMLRMQVPEITHPQDRQMDWELFQRVVRGESHNYRNEKRYVRKDGAVAWVNVNMTVIRDAGGQPLRTMATIEDITERKRLEQERTALEVQLRQQQKLESIGTLAGGVAHEINNPINGIMNYAQLIQDKLEPGSPLIEYTGEILHESHRVATIVRGLLTFSQSEKQSHSPARMADVVEGTLSLMRAVMRHDQITLNVNVPENLPELKCCSQQLQQVLMNLMINARDTLNERYPGHDPDKVLNVEARLIVKEGRRWIRVTIEDHGTGITPEVRVQNELRALFDMVPAMIWLKDKEDRILRVNQRVADMAGKSIEEIEGKSSSENYPQEAARHYEDDLDVIHSGVPKMGIVEKFRDPKGQELWVQTDKVPVLDKDGKVTGLVVMVQDISQRKRDEESLRASEERLRLATDAARMGTWDRDLKTNRLIWSPMEERLNGYEPGTFPGTEEAFWGLLHPDCHAAYAAAYQRVRHGDGIYHAELHYRLRDGRERWGLASGRLIHDPGGQPERIVGIDMDITERKRLEQERAIMEAQLRQQQRLESIGTLASGVAHEINNPITGILNYAQLIQDRLPAGSPLMEFTGEILHETERVASIVRHLLRFARHQKQTHSPARMADIVEDTLSLMRTMIRRDDITLTVNVPDNLPELKCRTQQIQQVLMNLMTNARDALNGRYTGHDPDKLLNLSAHLFEKGGRRWIRVTVEDHGTGITPEVRERMFDPFFTTKTRDQRTGLGLAISHGIIKEHHGELTVETEPGQFTRMHINLPADPV
jgi:PAS domain S-box-containing protein